jgi:hypothetical protein
MYLGCTPFRSQLRRLAVWWSPVCVALDDRCTRSIGCPWRTTANGIAWRGPSPTASRPIDGQHSAHRPGRASPTAKRLGALVGSQHPQMAIFTRFPTTGRTGRGTSGRRDRRRLYSLRRRPRAQGVSWRRPSHTCEWQEAHLAPPKGENPAPRRGVLLVDVGRCAPLNRCQGPLRPTACGRRSTHRPFSTLPRLPLRLPADGPDLCRRSCVPGSPPIAA